MLNLVPFDDFRISFKQQMLKTIGIVNIWESMTSEDLYGGGG